jgi:hypothetical protein
MLENYTPSLFAQIDPKKHHITIYSLPDGSFAVTGSSAQNGNDLSKEH